MRPARGLNSQIYATDAPPSSRATFGFQRPVTDVTLLRSQRRPGGPRRGLRDLSAVVGQARRSPWHDRLVPLNHVALTVSDRQRSAAFYGQHFGLTDPVHDDEHLMILGSPDGSLPS